MSEEQQDTPLGPTEQKRKYPGGLVRWDALRTEAEGIDVENNPEGRLLKACYEVAQELAGLNYILDGIRYTAKNM